MKPNPNSRASRALLALAGDPGMSINDFTRIVADICPTKEAMSILISDLKCRGFTERRIVLTQEGRAAAERLRA